MNVGMGNMPIEPSAKDVPDVTWEYWGIIDSMRNHPGLYILDELRGKCHVRLCKWYGLSRDVTKTITDNMDKYDNACQLHDALMDVKRKGR